MMFLTKMLSCVQLLGESPVIHPVTGDLNVPLWLGFFSGNVELLF